MFGGGGTLYHFIVRRRIYRYICCISRMLTCIISLKGTILLHADILYLVKVCHHDFKHFYLFVESITLYNFEEIQCWGGFHKGGGG